VVDDLLEWAAEGLLDPGVQVGVEQREQQRTQPSG
jgi:hypothetical protein